MGGALWLYGSGSAHLCGSGSIGLYSSGGAGLMQVGREVAGEWMFTLASRLLRAT